MTAAIYFDPEGYSTGGPRLMGRHAAGESFLRALFTHSKGSELWTQVDRPAHARAFEALARQHGRTEPVKAVGPGSLAALSQPGVVYHPGPAIGAQAWRRALHGHAAWSLCGITHTTSSAGAMDSIADLIAAPVQPWDALICTSAAVKHNVEQVLQAQANHVQERLGATRLVLPQLPVIPLGIHTQDFAFDADARAQARQALGADDATHVVLFMGRLSFHAKAHPLAMYRALQAAAGRLAPGERVLLVECGWHANELIATAYREAAAFACPDVRVVTLDGRKAQERQTAWAAADVFCSLSDNIQETFGIVPVEAMAAGVPVVVSDWDGYRETVRDGVDGFRIPTVMPGPGLGTDLALRHAMGIDSYDMYCGHACTMVAVDVPATAQAFERLFASPALRRRMGEAGRERARAMYDWTAIIPRYEALWAQLGEARRAAGPGVKAAQPWPARLDPFHAFASYPTRALASDTMLRLPPDVDLAAALEQVAACRRLAMVDFANAVLPTPEEVRTMLAAVAGGARPAVELVRAIGAPRQAPAFRSLAWLLKMDVLQVCG